MGLDPPTPNPISPGENSWIRACNFGFSFLGHGVACLSNSFELLNVLMTFIMAIKQLLIADFNNINTVIKRYKMLT